MWGENGGKKNPAGAGSGGRRGFEGVRSGEMIKRLTDLTSGNNYQKLRLTS